MLLPISGGGKRAAKETAKEAPKKAEKPARSTPARRKPARTKKAGACPARRLMPGDGALVHRQNRSALIIDRRYVAVVRLSQIKSFHSPRIFARRRRPLPDRDRSSEHQAPSAGRRPIPRQKPAPRMLPDIVDALAVDPRSATKGQTAFPLAYKPTCRSPPIPSLVYLSDVLTPQCRRTWSPPKSNEIAPVPQIVDDRHDHDAESGRI